MTLNLPHNLILASGSLARQNMLRQAGYEFDIIPADIDEETILKEYNQGDDVQKLALRLAGEKAKKVSGENQDKYIIGSDQILAMNNNIYSKAKNKSEAMARIKEFQGQSHDLYSAVSLYKNDVEIFSYCDKATLHMRDLSADEITAYCDKAGDALTSCVGCYALESIGGRLFERIEGDYFTILGMPLLPLIGALNEEGFGL